MLVLEQCGIQGARELGVLNSSCHRIAAASPVMMLVEVATDGCSLSRGSLEWQVQSIAKKVNRLGRSAFGSIATRMSSSLRAPHKHEPRGNWNGGIAGLSCVASSVKGR